jgi:hypothetical protein
VFLTHAATTDSVEAGGGGGGDGGGRVTSRLGSQPRAPFASDDHGFGAVAGRMGMMMAVWDGR